MTSSLQQLIRSMSLRSLHIVIFAISVALGCSLLETSVETLQCGPVAIHQFQTGKMGNFQYMIESAGFALLVDAAWDVEGILAYLKARGLNLAGGLYTHSHYDHVGGKQIVGAAELYRLGGDSMGMVRPATPLWIGARELESAASQSSLASSAWTALHDGDLVFRLGGVAVVAIDTPGHTRGGISYFVDTTDAKCLDGVLFTGDTLFPSSVGRTDLPGGSQEDLLQSLARIRQFPGGVIVFPGHNYGKTARTTISLESKTNSWMRAAAQAFGSFPPPLPRIAMRIMKTEL